MAPSIPAARMPAPPGICWAFYNFVLPRVGHSAPGVGHSPGVRHCQEHMTSYAPGIVKGNFIFSILKEVHASLFITRVSA